MPTNREAALGYAALGWRVFPTKKKQPLIEDWPHRASSDPAQVNEYWDSCTNADIGCVAGERFVTIDIDAPKKPGDPDGRETFAQLVQQLGPVPDGPISRTGGGGEQRFFWGGDAAIRSPVRIAPGVDIRGYDSLVILPESDHDSGNRYRWERSPYEIALPELPQAWRDWIVSHLADKRTNGNGASPVNGTIPEGHRNDTLFMMARKMRNAGFGTDAILSAISTENQRCANGGLPEKELVKLVNSSEHYSPVFILESDEDEEPDSPEPGIPVLPDAAWRGFFADWRDLLRESTEASPAFHFQTLWALVGARLRRRVWAYQGGVVFPNSYQVVIGHTGSKKSTAMKLGPKYLMHDGMHLVRGLGSAEALCDRMEQEKGKATLCYLDELCGLFIRGGWSGSTLLPLLVEAWDCPPTYEIPYRKLNVNVDEPTLTLLASTTPSWFWQNAKQGDFQGGLCNRLFFGTGAPCEPLAIPKPPDELAMREFVEALTARDASIFGETKFNNAASRVYSAFDGWWREQVATFDELTILATKRIPTYVLKLCLLYAVLEGTHPVITEDQAHAAGLVGVWGAECARWLVKQQQGHSFASRCEYAVLQALGYRKLPAYKIHHLIGGRFSAKETQDTLWALQRIGRIEDVGRTKRGKIIFARRRSVKRENT